MGDPLLFNPHLLNKFYNAYVQLSGNAIPYQGDPIEFRSKCSFEKESDPNTLTTCPNGYMNYPAWGLAGNPIQILDVAIDSSISSFYTGSTVFGFAHKELGKQLDTISSHPQYIFNSTSAEAWANIKLAYALDIIGDAEILLNDRI